MSFKVVAKILIIYLLTKLRISIIFALFSIKDKVFIRSVK